MCSMSREPRRLEYTICTAVAPDAVFTVRTYGDTRPPYGPHIPRISVQILAARVAKPQVTALTSRNPHDREPSRDLEAWGRRRALSPRGALADLLAYDTADRLGHGALGALCEVPVSVRRDAATNASATVAVVLPRHSRLMIHSSARRERTARERASGLSGMNHETLPPLSDPAGRSCEDVLLSSAGRRGP